MVSFINPGASVFLADLSRIENANQQTQQEISSGYQVSQPEDSPDQVSQLLTLQSNLNSSQQISTNLTNLQTIATTADQSITSVLQLADQASSLGAQGAGSTATAQTRQQLAQQVQGILNEVVSLSQTAIGGRYVFGGDADRSPSYQIDPSSPTGVLRLSTALNTSQLQDPSGGLIPTGLTAGQIFDARNADDSVSPNNLFASLNSLYQALNNNDSAGITTAISSIQQAEGYVNTQQSFYGALENRLTQGLSLASNLQLSLTTQISAIRDTNVSEAAVQLTQGTTDYQAALEAESKVPQTSLFNFLS